MGLFGRPPPLNPSLRGRWRDLVRVFSIFPNDPVDGIRNLAAKYHPVPPFAETFGDLWRKEDGYLYNLKAGEDDSHVPDHYIYYGKMGLPNSGLPHCYIGDVTGKVDSKHPPGGVFMLTFWYEDETDCGMMTGQQGGSGPGSNLLQFGGPNAAASNYKASPSWGNTTDPTGLGGDGYDWRNNVSAGNRHTVVISFGSGLASLTGCYVWVDGKNILSNTSNIGGRANNENSYYQIRSIGTFHLESVGYFNDTTSFSELQDMSGDPYGVLSEDTTTRVLLSSASANQQSAGTPLIIVANSLLTMGLTVYKTCLSFTQDTLAPAPANAGQQQIRRRPLPARDDYKGLHQAVTREFDDVWKRLAVQSVQATTITTDASIAHGLVLIDAKDNNVTAQLPAAAQASGTTVRVKRIDQGSAVNSTTAILLTTTPDVIDGGTTYTLTAQYQSVQVFSNGIQWYVV